MATEKAGMGPMETDFSQAKRDELMQILTSLFRDARQQGMSVDAAALESEVVTNEARKFEEIFVALGGSTSDLRKG